ncbi:MULTISPECIES: chromate transporter [Bacillaceae]|uniref:Chromate transporter n=1 Tax=Peribacillus huizhouensis TaxID=1501239 RepID=A0ABR6CP02_9BACI|nr:MULTISPECIES: chromate transporter [Bacillaceae]MBA9026753.1 chromate transporter [Peribacillus huizhouensis]
MKQLNIFMAFFRVGMLGFGGGPAAIPLVQKEVVEKYKWMNNEDFGDVLALGNALPGPIAPKLAGYIGYRVGGFWGLLNGVFASCVPTILLMILLLKSLNAYKNQAWVTGMSQAVVPVVAVMLLTMTLDFLKKSGSSSIGWLWTIVFVLLGFVFMELLNVHPAIIIFSLLIGALLKRGPVSEPNKEAGKS